MTTTPMYDRGYEDGALDAAARHNTSIGPNSPWGNQQYDAGYAAGWAAETERLG